MKKMFLAIFILCALLTPLGFAADDTAAIEELYKIELLPRLRSGDTCKMFSSYDRTGGNNDGFKGDYSKIRVEDGNSLLAEMEGAGCIQRIWFTYSGGEPGLLGLKKEHIRIYLDGEKTPALDVPLEDLFTGKLEGFPRPLVNETQGGFYCYVPIPYRNGCKVWVDGTTVRFYQIGYRTFPSDKGVATFRYPPSDSQKKALDDAAKAWSACGDVAILGAKNADKVVKSFDLKAGESLEWTLPKGPRMVRAVYLEAKPDSLANVNDARIQLTWDDATEAAVDLPVDYFFCQAKPPTTFKSLLVGDNGKAWYNFLPMPYRKSGKLTIKTAKPLAGTLTLLTAELPPKSDNLGYFHAAYNESLPTTTGKFHTYLDRKGKGHVVGVYLTTDGQSEPKLPIWLEGDEQFTCDGELRIHGTGTEDGFNCGWYALAGRLDHPSAAPVSGFPVYRMEGEKNIATAFRWYVSDPVAYEKTMLFELEHGGTNDVNANYRTTTFYYDANP
jgi:hypothetical protein